MLPKGERAINEAAAIIKSERKDSKVMTGCS
jgi:hypothetical protein